MKKWKKLSLSAFAVALQISLSGLYVYAQENPKKETGTDKEVTAEQLERLRNDYAPWNPNDIDKLRKRVGLIGPGPQEDYPKPKYPKILKPKSVEEVMQKARAAVTQKGGLGPIGLADPGDKILIVVPVANRGGGDPIVQEGVKRAFAERKIDAHIMYDFELLGVPKEELIALEKAQRSVWKAGEGERELHHMLNEWPAGQAWMREKYPALYQKTYRDVQYPNAKLADLARNYEKRVEAALIKYLDDHPEYDKFFYRQGGPTKTRTRMKHHGKRYFGNYMYLSHFDLMSDAGEFPSDVWKMLENKTMEPLKYVNRIEASDPEGTAVYAEFTEDVAQAWAEGVYQQGHLYMFPTQATGRYPYSTVDYPAYKGKFLMPRIVKANGVVAGTNSHNNTQPRMEVWFKDGYISEVKGGGIFGEAYRRMLNYPKINEATWPFAEKPGWWWFFEAGTATNPKFNKSPIEVLQGSNLTERLAGGTIHWSTGLELKHGPEVNGKLSPKTEAFSKETGLPIWHGQHIHTLLPTYQVRIKDAGKWMTLIEHGTLTSMRDPEVRALASRYGNPDEILSRDYYPPFPGINVKGDYEKDYLKDTGAYWTKWATDIINGTSPYLQ